MDLTSVVGVIGIFGLAVISAVTGQVSAALLNFHGVFIVLGGASVAILINSPFPVIESSLRSLVLLFRSPTAGAMRDVVGTLVTASQNVHARGINALGGLDPLAAGGFLARAAQIAMEFKDPKYVQEVLESELRHEMERQGEIVNLWRTLSVLFPMFGLIGTLLGIVDVLKHMANPESVGPAMAVAITSAFYGISLANLVATPIAGKLRTRFRESVLVKAVIVEAVTEMLKGTAPVLIERRLEAYLV